MVVDVEVLSDDASLLLGEQLLNIVELSVLCVYSCQKHSQVVLVCLDLAAGFKVTNRLCDRGYCVRVRRNVTIVSNDITFIG